MGRTRNRKDEKEEFGARAGIVPAIKLVLEEVAREEMAAPTLKEREKVRYCIRGATSKYSRFQLRVEGKERVVKQSRLFSVIQGVLSNFNACLPSRKLILIINFLNNNF